MQAFTRPLANPDHPGATAWWLGACARPRTHEAARALAARGRLMMIDGPYALPAGEAYLRDHLVGRVVGVLAARRQPAVPGRPLSLAAPRRG